MSRSWVEVDTEAIRHNVATLLALADGAQLCAVVKANAYGHGSIQVSKAALDGGASLLAVAQVAEGIELREAGIDAPIWVLSEPEAHEFAAVVAHRLEPVVYTQAGIDAATMAASTQNPLPVHLKINTGMNRVGVECSEATVRAKQIAATPRLVCASVMTHCATSDEPENPFTDLQIDRFEEVLAELKAAGLPVPRVHAANSAATILFPRAHFDVVRCGIALYGVLPSPDLAGRIELKPAMTWKTKVGFVKRLDAGERVSYGLRGHIEKSTTVVSLPVGYADGFRRAAWNIPGVVLIGGKPRNVVGIVTMDQIVVDVGDDDVHVGDEVVLLGRQGEHKISADFLAEHLDTIGYEVVCDIGARVERRYVSDRS